MANPPAGEELIIDIPLELVQLSSTYWLERCINRVPKQLRKVNKEAYTPKLISIGPFHHHRTELRDMEMHKLIYFKKFLDRTGKSEEDLRKIIEDDEKKIRLCYSEDCSLGSGNFIKMILLDAIFIIELFLNVIDQKNREDEEEEDYILRKKWLSNGIYYDLLLLENQIPFFVLEKLYKFAFNDSSSCNHREEGKQVGEHKKDLEKDDAPFVKLSRNYFSNYDQCGISENTKKPIGKEVKHFTDLLRYLLCSSVSNCSTDQKPLETRYIYCAKELDGIGLKFKAAEKIPLLEIKFHRNSCRSFFDCSCLLACLPCFKCFPFLKSMQCIVEVPPVQIDNYTEAFFRNLMVLEQWDYTYNAYICNYVRLLNCLINTEEDVDLLVKKKVIVNMLGSNGEVAALINKLCYQIPETRSPYDDLVKNLNDHYEFSLNQILATLKKEYFPNIFRGTATILGLIVLGFTLWSFIRPYVGKT